MRGRCARTVPSGRLEAVGTDDARPRHPARDGRPARCGSCADRGAHRASRADGHAVVRRRCDVDRSDPPAGVRARRRTRAGRARRVLAHAGPGRPTRHVVRRSVPAGPVPHRRSRRHLEPRRRMERSPELVDVGGVARRRRHARRFDAAFGQHRSARSEPPLPRPLGWWGVRVDRRRRRLGTRSTRARRRLPARPRRAVRPRSALRADAPAEARPAVPAEPLRHLPARPTATRWERIGDAMPRDVGDIGFPVELHPRDPDTVWVFPMDGTDVWPRSSPDGRPAVYVTRDAGRRGSARTTGSPSGRGSP